ncbi:bacterio-opsin activator domain-containing protein [Halorussus halobius]|uniref:bacterio-opsin activator domain-containing protein n=1 Tax=Halorussus halobius TaxID=1710537 RepID=UPI0010926E41|nr:bacterio-opsin activator domain-containing protein [Halorussus halobius]
MSEPIRVSPVPAAILGERRAPPSEVDPHELAPAFAASGALAGPRRFPAEPAPGCDGARVVADGGVDGDYVGALAEALSDALLVIDVDSVVRFANPAVEDVFGYRPDELVGESLSTLMSPDVADRHRAGVRRYLDTGERTLDWDAVALVGRHEDGTEVPVEVSFSEFTVDGQRRFAGVVRDVAERNRREAELRHRVRQQRAVASLSRAVLDDRPLDDLFDEAVELVADALDHEYATVLERRPREDDLLVRAGVGWRDGVVGSATVAAERGSQPGYTLLSAEPVVVTDLDAETRFTGAELLTDHGVTSGVSTVVGPSEDPWGILGVHDTESRTYADHDVQFVQSVARLLATAVDRREREHTVQRRERKLTALTGTAGSLADAETPAAICELAVDAAVDVLEFPNAAVARYDDDAGSLAPAVQRWAGDGVDDALLEARSEGVAWQAFVAGESEVVDDLAPAGGSSRAGSNAPVVRSVVAVPLGKHGVLLAGAPDRAAFDATDASLADLLCSNVRSALDRAEREATLRERRDELRVKNRELERVDRINSVVRELARAVTLASSPQEVMQAACDRLTDAGPYRFAWFGTRDRATDEVTPEAWAGVEQGYLEEVVVTADDTDERGRGPTGRAVRTAEIQVQNDLLGDPPFEPWREQALKRGYRSSASVPVEYGDAIRGVLNLYAGETDAFDETERNVLVELGELLGYGLNALEQRQALVSDRSIELDFRVRGSSTAVLAFVSETGATFEFDNAVQRTDGRLHAYFTVRGVSAEETLAFVEDVSWVEDVRLVADRDDECLYEAALADESFLRSLVDRGGMPRSETAADGEARFVVRIPPDGDVRQFVELFEAYYDDVELVARRAVDEPVMTRRAFEAELADRLTDRQREVVRTAYLGGFFEWPRESTAQEVADALGVSQPTVSRHVRAAERALFGLLFEEG